MASPPLLQFIAILSPFIPNPTKRVHWGGGGTHPYKAGFGGCAARMLAPRKPRQGNLIFESSLVYMIIPRPAKAIYRASLSLSLSH